MLGVTVPGFPLPDTALHRRVDAALDAMDITPFADRFYTTLSGGERQRVHIARAMCQLAAAALQHAKDSGRNRCEVRCLEPAPEGVGVGVAAEV